MKAFICDHCQKTGEPTNSDQKPRGWMDLSVSWPWKQACSNACAHAIVDELLPAETPAPAADVPEYAR